MYPDGFSNRHPTQSASGWSLQDDKKFEEGLVIFPEEFPDRWRSIAEKVNKSVREVKERYEALVHDVYEIESGRVKLPTYADEYFWSGCDEATNEISLGSEKSKKSEGGGSGEKKRGTPWTEEEHRLFLMGLKEYGKGDWRSISRKVVVTRTPTQVASHAQKYFLRQDCVVKKVRKRSSIHDITTPDNIGGVPVDQSRISQPAEPLQLPQTKQTQPHSGHFSSHEGLIPSTCVHDQEEGGSFGYPNFNFSM